QRGPVMHLAFDTGGKWLAALDQAGFLRVFCGFSACWFSAAYSTSNRQEVLMKTWETPSLMIETRVDDPAGISSISATADSVVLYRGNGSTEEFKVLPSELPEEVQLDPDIAHLSWNADASELSVTTMTDAFWLHVSPLDFFLYTPGINVAG